MISSELITAPEIRIETAKKIILGICPQLDQTNIFGIASLGSFWTKNEHPHDIDLAIYTNNDSLFSHADQPRIDTPLTDMFHIPTEFHIITPYTPSVKNGLEHTKLLLEEATVLWGNFPSWAIKENKSLT